MARSKLRQQQLRALGMRRPALLVAFLRSPRKAPWAPPGSCIVTHADYVATGWTLGPMQRPRIGVYDRQLAMAGGETANWVDLRCPAKVRRLAFDWCDTQPVGSTWSFYAWSLRTGEWARL